MNQSLRTKSIVIILLAVSFIARAQYLPLNSSGKCEAAEVVAVDSLTKPQLYTNEVQWFKHLPASGVKITEIAKDSLEGKISANVETLVYAQSGILKKIAGSISYRIIVESKDGKYRYSISSFLFHYYAQDRTYQIVKTSRTKPLEESKASGWQKLWSQHRQTIAALVNSQISELKLKMIETPQLSNSKTEEKKVDW